MVEHYDLGHDFDNNGLPSQAKEWIDARVQQAGSEIYRNGLQVLTSGFGKGLVAAAALLTVGIVGLAIFAPAVLALPGALPLGQALSYGFTIAGNTMLGSSVGITALLAGGVVGSMAQAHTENGRINKALAEQQAQSYALLREQSLSQQSPSQTPEFCNEVSGGHCAKLMQEQQNKERGVGV